MNTVETRKNWSSRGEQLINARQYVATQLMFKGKKLREFIVICGLS